MKQGQFSHGLFYCDKFIQACLVFEPAREDKKESGLMTVDEFIKSFEKKQQRYLTNKTSTYTIRREQRHVT